MTEPQVEALLSRLTDGSLTAPDRRYLADALRRDPNLRQQLRSQAITDVRLHRAVRHLPRPSLRLVPIATRRPLWPWLTAAAVAAAAIVITWSMSASSIPAPTQESAPLASIPSNSEPISANPDPSPDLPPEINLTSPEPAPQTVAETGPFTLPDRAGEMVFANDTRIDFEPGSSGTMAHFAGEQRVVQLTSGGARVRSANKKDSYEIHAGKAKITAEGDVAVRYLQTDDGIEPAFEVQVGLGSARLEFAGKKHEISHNQSRIFSPTNKIRAQILPDPNRSQLVLQALGGKDRSQWRLDPNLLPPLTCHRRSVDPKVLKAGWQVEIELDPSSRNPAAIEIPDQLATGTLSTWDPQTRTIAVNSDRRNPPLTWQLSATMAFDSNLIGKRVRVTYEPLMRSVKKITAFDPQNRTQPAATDSSRNSAPR